MKPGSAIGQRALRTQIGTLFAVPLIDGSFGIIQRLGEVLPGVVESVLFSRRVALPNSMSPALLPDEAVAIVATWTKSFSIKDWIPVTSASPVVEPGLSSNRARLSRRPDGSGIELVDPGYLRGLLEAWHGLAPWNVHGDPLEYDKRLLPNVLRPASANVLRFDERRAFRAAQGLPTVREPHEA